MQSQYFLLLSLTLVALTSSHGGEHEKESNAEKPTPAPEQSLLLVVLGGLSNQHLDDARYAFSNVDRFVSDGLTAKAMYSRELQHIFPNIYSMMTGLEPQQHGMLSDNMYNSTTSTMYTDDVPDKHSSDYWLVQGETLWQKAKNNNIGVRLLSWPGCPTSETPMSGDDNTMQDVCSSGANPAGDDNIQESLEQAVALLNDSNIRLVGVYTQSLATAMATSTNYLAAIDTVFTAIETTVRRRVNSNTNVLVVSDYAMYTVKTNESRTREASTPALQWREVFVNDTLDSANIVIGQYTHVCVWAEELCDQMYKNLMENDRISEMELESNCKKQTPSSRSVVANRSCPLLLKAHPGYVILKNDEHPPSKYGLSGYSYTGSDNREDRFKQTIMLGYGPAFRTQTTKPIRAFPNTDVYHLAGAVLGLDTDPSSKEIYDTLEAALTHPPTRPRGMKDVSFRSVWVAGVSAFFGMAAFSLCVIGLCYCRSRRPMVQYKHLDTELEASLDF